MQKAPSRDKRRTSNWKVFLCLLVCFPYGLLLMWRGARWHPAAKCAVTACFVCLTGLILLPQTGPPARQAGGVELVGAEVSVEVFGPELPSAFDASYMGYGGVTSSSSILSAPEEKETAYVYANGRGKYYHKLTCRFVEWYSDKLSPAVAHYSGYLPCEECGVTPYQPG